MSPTHGKRSTYIDHGCRCELCTEANTAGCARGAAVRRASRPETNPTLPHGTWATYCNWSCRCADCKRAGSDENRRARERRQVTGPSVHGTASAYRAWGCRCDDCKTAAAAAWRAYYLRRKTARQAS